MMLELYIRVAGFEREGVGKQTEKEAVLTVDDLVLYLERQLIFLQRRHHGTKGRTVKGRLHSDPCSAGRGKEDGVQLPHSEPGWPERCKSYERLKQAQFVERFPDRLRLRAGRC